MRNFKRSYCGEISEDWGTMGGVLKGFREDFGSAGGSDGSFLGSFRGKRGLFHVFLRFFTLFLGFFGFFRKKVKNYLVMCTKPCIFISETNTHTNHKKHKP